MLFISTIFENVRMTVTMDWNKWLYWYELTMFFITKSNKNPYLLIFKSYYPICHTRISGADDNSEKYIETTNELNVSYLYMLLIYKCLLLYFTNVKWTFLIFFLLISSSSDLFFLLLLLSFFFSGERFLSTFSQETA